MGLPFKDSLFDVVVSVASIKHWPDAKRGLQEIRCVLKLDGEAFVGEVDRCAPDEEINWFADNSLILIFCCGIDFSKNCKMQNNLRSG